MNDSQCKTTVRAAVPVFVNCQLCGWVTEKPCLKWASRPWQGRGGAVRVAFGSVVNLNGKTPHLCPLPFGRGEATLRTADRCGRRLSVGLLILLKWMFG